jgi:Tetratricopeptide repeat
LWAGIPLDWATTQNNLGTALSTLGERESGTARLEEAVAAYRAALEENTRERVPLGGGRGLSRGGQWPRKSEKLPLVSKPAAYQLLPSFPSRFGLIAGFPPVFAGDSGTSRSATSFCPKLKLARRNRPVALDRVAPSAMLSAEEAQAGQRKGIWQAQWQSKRISQLLLRILASIASKPIRLAVFLGRTLKRGID